MPPIFIKTVLPVAPVAATAAWPESFCGPQDREETVIFPDRQSLRSGNGAYFRQTFPAQVAGNARRPVGGVGPADKTVAVQSAAQRILGA